MKHPLAELARVFLKLGTISFGGSAAHIALMEHEIVQRRNWVSRQHFLDLIAATYLIPGPNAVEMAAHVGYLRAGLLGSLVGALSFTFPAVVITIGIAWAYQHYGSLPQVEPFLYGIKAAVLAVIFTAVFRLGRQALRNWQLRLIAVGVAAASLIQHQLDRGDEVVTLLVGSLVGLILLGRGGPDADRSPNTVVGALAGTTSAAAPAAKAAVLAAGAAVPAAVPLWKLGLFFLKVGAVWFGGGYVLVAYLDGRVPDWLSRQELLDAVAVGQLTPGPMFSMVTFVGYLVGTRGGCPIAAAVVATVAVLLPSFFFVTAVNPLVPKLRGSPWASRLLDSVGASAIGLMAAVTLTLCHATLIDQQDWPWVDWRGCLIAVAAGAAMLRLRIAPVWLVLAGAAAGWCLFQP